jgi:hypothetical protein
MPTLLRTLVLALSLPPLAATPGAGLAAAAEPLVEGGVVYREELARR